MSIYLDPPDIRWADLELKTLRRYLCPQFGPIEIGGLHLCVASPCFAVRREIERLCCGCTTSQVAPSSKSIGSSYTLRWLELRFRVPQFSELDGWRELPRPPTPLGQMPRGVAPLSPRKASSSDGRWPQSSSHGQLPTHVTDATKFGRSAARLACQQSRNWLVNTSHFWVLGGSYC